MKRITATTALLAAALIFGSTGYLGAIDVTFNGYSDGVYLDIDRETGLVNGFLTGSVEGDIMGFLGGVENQGTSMILTYTGGSLYEGLTTVLRADHTWSHYFHDGTQMLELNTGDWSVGMPVVAYGENVTSSLDIVAAPGNTDDATRVIIKKHPKGTEAVAVPGNADGLSLSPAMRMQLAGPS